jgi:hypothetical protein
LLALSTLTLAVNVGSMLSHFSRPRLKPLTFQSSTVLKTA